MSSTRIDGRAHAHIRPLTIQYDTYGYSDASVLLSLGNTKVMVAVTLQNGVPPFLKGQRTGWLTAEYAMLPHATHQRTQRDGSSVQRNGRSVEISRIISRCLRQVVDYALIGEKTIIVDCDVLQADGSTRVACITAASIALELAVKRWVEARIIEKNIFKQRIAALSLGIVNGTIHTDLNYAEDSQADVDFNIVLTQSNTIVELLGSSEKQAISWDKFDEIKTAAIAATSELFSACAGFPLPNGPHPLQMANNNTQQGSQNKAGLFSLANRLKN